jgi:hypothetical protein
MKPSSKPANDYTDQTEFILDPAEAAAQGANTACVVTWAEGLVERGVISEAQRRDAEHALWAMLTAGTSRGPRDDRARDVVRRMLIASQAPTPPKHREHQRRAALVRVLEFGKWDGTATIRSLRRVDLKFRTITKEAFEKAIDPSVHRFAARLSVAFGAFNDHEIGRAFDAFAMAAREQSRKPRKRVG